MDAGSVGRRARFSDEAIKLLGYLHAPSSRRMHAKSESKSSGLLQIFWALLIKEKATDGLWLTGLTDAKISPTMCVLPVNFERQTLSVPLYQYVKKR